MRKLYLCLSVILLMLAELGSAQRTVSGKVLNSADQSPLGGVSIRLKGTKTGTVTGIDGSFLLSTSEANPQLELSSVGY